MKYSEWIVQWLSRKEPLVKESTFAAYSNIVVNHLRPKFGKFDLEKITETTMQDYAFELVKSGRLDGTGGVNERTAKDIVVVLKNSLKAAMRMKLLPQTVFEIKFPSHPDSCKINVLSKEIQQRLVQAVYLNLNNRNVGIILSLYTGLRIGEICGLQWKDIDLETKTLHVRRTLQRVYKKELNGKGKSKLLIGSPKSRTSARGIPLSQTLVPVLRKVQSPNGDHFVIGGKEKCVEVRTFRTYFETFLKKHEIERMRFHDLRHTFATRCIEMGGDCKTVSELLGHATVNMTLNLYVHPQMEQKRLCVDRLEIF